VGVGGRERRWERKEQVQALLCHSVRLWGRGRKAKSRGEKAKCPPFVVVELPDAVDDVLVPLPGAVPHVEPCHVHALLRQDLQHLRAAAAGPDGADDLRPPCAAESCEKGCAFIARCTVCVSLHCSVWEGGGGGGQSAAAAGPDGAMATCDSELGLIRYGDSELGLIKYGEETLFREERRGQSSRVW